MKFFIDTANLNQIEEAQNLGVLRWCYYKSILNGKRGNHRKTKYFRPLC